MPMALRKLSEVNISKYWHVKYTMGLEMFDNKSHLLKHFENMPGRWGWMTQSIHAAVFGVTQGWCGDIAQRQARAPEIQSWQNILGPEIT